MKFQHYPETPLNLKSITVNNQRWYVAPSGKQYPSITTILSQKIKPKIQEWRQILGYTNAAKEINRCITRGTTLHETIEQYLKNENLKQHTDPLNGKLFSQTKMMLNRINNIHLQEAALYNDKLKIAGRVDCVAEFDNILSVIDFKTSTNNKTLKMIADYKLQCTAYTLMFNEQYNGICEDIVIIIGVEKGIVAQVFKDKIDKYISPLLKRINAFYETL